MAPGPVLLLLLLLLLLSPVLLGAAPAAPQSPRGRVSCLSPAPSLSWYLEGEDEEDGGGGGGRDGGRDGGGRLSLALRARRLERTLRNCSASQPDTDDDASVPVLLEVHFQPELVQMEEAWWEEEAAEEAREDPGLGVLVLALVVLVQARPPAHIAWSLGPEGEGPNLGNASRFLIVGARTYPWPPERALRFRLGTPRRRPPDNASFLPEGLLGARVELPLVALVAGSAVALGTVLGLLSLLSCLLCCRRNNQKDAPGPPFLAPLTPRDRNNLKPGMPRANVSLPANLRLNSLPAETKGQEESLEEDEEGERALSEPENSLVLGQRGLGRFPMVGYIYRASSMSSDEIWL